MDLREDARACLAAALAGVDPAAAVGRCLAREGAELVLRDRDGRERARHAGPVVVVGAGKAVVAMARAATRVVPPDTAGICVAPHGTSASDLAAIELRTAAHPVPDTAGVRATEAVLDAVGRAGPDTLVLVLLSGGASALLVAPADGLSLADKQAVTRDLVTAGAEIGALNAVRKHCSRVKGGGLARAAAGARACWTLVLSDVVGDDPATIGSGPTVPDPTTHADALATLARYRVEAPLAVRDHLVRGAAGATPETMKAGDPAAGGIVVVAAGNADAVAAAARAAATRGYAVREWPHPLAGDAAAEGRALAAALRGERGPIALIAGGEPTVRAVGDGVGGRAQHLALAAAVDLAGLPAVLLAAGTDGVDGPTDAAGACVDGGTVERLCAAGIDPASALASTDSHRALEASGDLVRTGPTGTNVADVVVALRVPA